jgi:RNA polymerase sigma factor (sigma-70 family)
MTFGKKGPPEQLEHDFYTSANESHRHFTPQGFLKLNELLGQIKDNNPEATNEFIHTIQPWIAETRQRIAMQTLGTITIDDHEKEDQATDALLHLMDDIQLGDVPNWSNFSGRFQRKIRSLYEKMGRNKKKMNDASFISLDEEVTDTDGKNVQRHETMTSRNFTESEDRFIRLDELKSALQKVLDTMSERHRRIIEARYGMNGKEITLETLGGELGIHPKTVRELEKDALKKLQNPIRARNLEGFMTGQGGYPAQRKDTEFSRVRKNSNILLGIEKHLVNPKKTILELWKKSCGDSDAFVHIISERTDVPEMYVSALSNVEKTNADKLKGALQTRIIEKLKVALPPQKREIFEKAVQKLNQYMALFEVMGGRCIDLKDTLVQDDE